jgi:hypothetical protein
MLHACAARFDVMFWGEIFWELNTPIVESIAKVHRQSLDYGPVQPAYNSYFSAYFLAGTIFFSKKISRNSVLAYFSA